MKSFPTRYKAEFEAIFNSITDAVVVTDTKRQIVLINPAFTQIFGYHLDQLKGKTTQVIYADPECFLRQGKIRYNANKENNNPVYENEYRCKDGTVFVAETLGTHIKDEDGKLYGFLGVIRDISDRIEAQKQLKESEDRFRALHEASFGGVAIHDNGLILDCNQGLSNITGYSSSELVGMDGLNLIAQASLERVLENIKSGHEERYEVEGIRKDGSNYPLSVRGKNVIYKGKDVRIIEFQDITKEKQAEKALRENEERFRLAFETNPDPVILARLQDGAIIDLNKAFEDVTGITRVEALGHNSEELGLWKNKNLRIPFREQLQANGQVTNSEADFIVRGGLVKTGLLSARIITSNNIPCILLVIRDITKEKAVERALVEMDQMKSNFISIAAHELRTPLTAIMGYTELLLDPVSSQRLDEETKQRFLHEIYSRGETLNRMIKDFLDVSRIEEGLPIPMDLHETDFTDVLRKVVNYYQLHEGGHSFDLILPEEPYNSEITIDRHRINQVLENLLSNAVKYSPKGGHVKLRGELRPEGWNVSVEDDGIGMNPEQLIKVFDKFYRADTNTNKADGLGLGMSIVKHLIEAHGGSIDVKSEQDKGTTVSFILPYAAQ
jgi:PAS domain S-box-containing protein